MDISVVVPLFNEEESLPELFAWIERVMKENNFTYEVIFVNDGSTDRSWEVIEKLSRESECVRGIKFRRNYGKSPALHCGFAQAKGDVVITMDADLQDSPDEIPELYHMVNGRRLRPRFGLQEKTLRPAFKDNTNEAVQRHGTQDKRNKEPARLQLRPQGIPQGRGKEHRSVRRDAPLHPLPCKERRLHTHRREGSTPGSGRVNTASRSSG